MSMYYKLDENKNAIPCDIHECEEQLEKMSRTLTKHVKDENVNGYRISTIWLGLNYNWNDVGQPLILETMVFKDYSGYDLYCDRYSTWKEAEDGHKKAVEWVKNGCKEEDCV